jgi:hypothetical protein
MIADLTPDAVEWLWRGAIALVLLALVFAGIAIGRGTPRSGLVGLVPVVFGVLAIVAGIELNAPAPWYPPALAVALAALGILGGFPMTVWVLGLAGSRTRRGKRDQKPSTHDASDDTEHGDDGEHGGIVVPVEGTRKHHEVLRGGWVIGYLERIAVIAAVALGRFEIVAAVIAVKGLGRFTELDNAVARERFIIGTLTSLTWAGACGLLVARVLA